MSLLNERYGRIAVDAGARFLAFVISVSASHNHNNVRQDPLESVEEYRRLNERLSPAIDMRLNIATAFDCPFENRVSQAAVVALLDRAIPLRPDAEICLCDTTGRATPDQVEKLFVDVIKRYPKVKRWAMHAHDTYGLGLANVVAAHHAGVGVFDGAFAGLGGCPFAPGAKGNVATEDVVWDVRQDGTPDRRRSRSVGFTRHRRRAGSRRLSRRPRSRRHAWHSDSDKIRLTEAGVIPKLGKRDSDGGLKEAAIAAGAARWRDGSPV